MAHIIFLILKVLSVIAGLFLIITRLFVFETIQFRAQPGEREVFEKAAKKEDAATLSDWIRETQRKAAD